MQINAIDGPEKKIGLELSVTEAGHLMAFLMHAKFSEDVHFDVVGSPTMNGLIRGLLKAGRDLGESTWWWSGREPWVIGKDDGEPPKAFGEIERHLQAWRKRDDVAEDLREWLYPFIWVKPIDGPS